MYFQRPHNFQSSQYYYQQRYTSNPVSESPPYVSSSPYYVPSLSFSPSDSAALTHCLDTPTTEGVLDAITQDFIAAPPSNGIDVFMTAKRTFAARSVEDILGLIYERDSLCQGNIRKIDYETSAVKTRLFEFDKWRWGLNPQMERVRFGVEHELRALEGEKRKEEVECWRDTTRLRGELREAMREFGQENRKMGIMNASSNPGR